MSVVHIYGSPPRGSADKANLAERFCRPGAAFGPEDVEERMGVRTVFHENTKRHGHGIRCTTCGAVE